MSPRKAPLIILGECVTSGNSVSAAVRVLPPGTPGATRAPDSPGARRTAHPPHPLPTPIARVDAQLAGRILTLRPTLAQHACKQRSFGRFGDKIVGSTLPHLVEHVAIDLLVEDGQGPVAGATTWLDRGSGAMTVRLAGPAHAEVTYAALNRAVTLVNSLLEPA